MHGATGSRRSTRPDAQEVPRPPTWPYILIGLVVLLCLVGGAAAAWKLSANYRKMRKMQSNQAMATDCAEAIAIMEFSTMQWLLDLPNPSRTQSAFMKIIHNLQTIRQYVPDAVLQTLISGADAAPQESNTRDAGPEGDDQPQNARSVSTKASTHGRGRGSRHSFASSQVSGPSCPSPRRWSVVSKGSAKRPPSTFRKAAVMAIEYHWTEDHQEQRLALMLPSLLRLNQGFVNAIKAEKGTLDSVSAYGLVATWGVVHGCDWANLACTAALRVLEFHSKVCAGEPLSPRVSIVICAGPCSLWEVAANGMLAKVVVGDPVQSVKFAASLRVEELIGSGIVIDETMFERWCCDAGWWCGRGCAPSTCEADMGLVTGTTVQPGGMAP